MNRTQELIINPKKPHHYKMACHKLMQEIWGTSKEGKREAYAWIKKNFGKTIHFSQINDENELRIIWEKMYKYSFDVEYEV